MSAQYQQIKIMLELQDAMNTKVNANWQHQGYEWYRAIWVECAELMDHYGWKWWKKQSPDTEQVALELIDIWHFGLSILLQSGTSQSDIIAKIQNELVVATDEKDFRLDLEKFAGATLADKQFHIGLFARLMAGVDMSFDQLYRGYVGKNVLNFFRQDHGYKVGTYNKIWGDNREDNQHLVEISAQLNVLSETFARDLYEKLNDRYVALNDSRIKK